MKLNKILSSAVFLFLLYQPAFSQSSWQWLNPKPESNIYYNLSFFDNHKGVAGSTGGTILITSDGGLNWKKSIVKSECVIEDVVFIDSSLIIAITSGINNNNGSILISRDFGDNWKILNFVLRSQNYLAAKFINSTTGFILSSSGSIFKTTDKCMSWNTYPQRFNFNLNSEIVFAGNNTGFINTQNGVIMTTDCGISWSVMQNAPAGLTNIYFYQNNLHAVSSNRYYSSSNYGENWESEELSFSTSSPSKIRAFNNMLCLFFGSKIYKSVDEGASWSSVLIEDEIEAELMDGEFVNNTLILAGNGLYSFQPQSGIFQPLLNGIRNNIKSGKSVNSSTSFAIGNKGVLIKTIDGGNTWNRINLSTKADLSSICIKGNNVHITGDSGVYLYSSNLGVNWTKRYFVFPLGSNDINNMHFLNESIGLVSSKSGLLKITSNGGEKWLDKNAASGPGIFKYLNTNIIAGVSNVFYKSTNNGTTWSIHTIDNGRTFFDMCFLNTNIGFIASDSGNIYKTTNGGANWDKKVVESNSANLRLSKVLFINSQTGFCIGNNGRFYFSTSGGQNWTRQMIYTSSDFTDIESLNWRACMIYGNNGLVMKNENVTDAHSVSISGKVLYNDNMQPVTSGHVKAVNYDYVSGITTVFDSTQINSDGTYILRNVRIDSSYIVAYPNSELVQDFIPTYHPSSIMWMQAIIVYPSTNLENVDISAHRILSTPGSSSISGSVFYTLLSNPVSNVTIAAKLNNNFSKMDYSTSGGTYTLNQLSPGSYKIFFDKLGYKNDSINVSLVQQQNIVVNINLNNAITNLTGDGIPTSYKLYQNYPNPFNPATKIEFDLPKASFVKLIIYDVLGREVASLINQELTRGKYAYAWSAKNTPSGIYFCNLIAGDYSKTMRMLLIK